MPEVVFGETLAFTVSSSGDFRTHVIEACELWGLGRKFDHPCPGCGDMVEVDVEAWSVEDLQGYAHCADYYTVKVDTE